MSKINDIYDGYLNLLTGLGDQELAKARLTICYECEHRLGPICGKCYCLLAAAVNAPDKKCPIKKW